MLPFRRPIGGALRPWAVYRLQSICAQAQIDPPSRSSRGWPFAWRVPSVDSLIFQRSVQLMAEFGDPTTVGLQRQFPRNDLPRSQRVLIGCHVASCRTSVRTRDRLADRRDVKIDCLKPSRSVRDCNVVEYANKRQSVLRSPLPSNCEGSPLVEVYRRPSIYV